jgi:hypothetical protein
LPIAVGGWASDAKSVGIFLYGAVAGVNLRQDMIYINAMESATYKIKEYLYQIGLI